MPIDEPVAGEKALMNNKKERRKNAFADGNTGHQASGDDKRDTASRSSRTKVYLKGGARSYRVVGGGWGGGTESN